MEILVTGSTGFVGRNLEKYLALNRPEAVFRSIERTELCSSNLEIKCQSTAAVIHLAGKAHDLKNNSNEQEYFDVNTGLTEKIFNAFLESEAEVFIMISSVKAVADAVEGVLDELKSPNPITAYGKSKLKAEQFIQSKTIPVGKRVYILRPCMIHGPGNKGNLNLLFKTVRKGLPWPLAAFDNKRSFCCIENLCFVIQRILQQKNIPSGIYNVADDEAISTNELIGIIAATQSKKAMLLNLPKWILNSVASIGDYTKLPLNTSRLHKLTENYIVSNQKISVAIGQSLPIKARDGLVKTINSF